MRIFQTILLGLFTMLALSAYADIAPQSHRCKDLEITFIHDSNELAHTMGKYKIFDLKFMQMFEDDQPIPQGQIIIVDGEEFRPEVVTGYVTDTAGVYSYQLKNSQKFTINYNNLNLRVRDIASIDKNNCKALKK